MQRELVDKWRPNWWGRSLEVLASVRIAAPGTCDRMRGDYCSGPGEARPELTTPSSGGRQVGRWVWMTLWKWNPRPSAPSHPP